MGSKAKGKANARQKKKPEHIFDFKHVFTYLLINIKNWPNLDRLDKYYSSICTHLDNRCIERVLHISTQRLEPPHTFQHCRLCPFPESSGAERAVRQLEEDSTNTITQRERNRMSSKYWKSDKWFG